MKTKSKLAFTLAFLGLVAMGAVAQETGLLGLVQTYSTSKKEASALQSQIASLQAQKVSVEAKAVEAENGIKTALTQTGGGPQVYLLSSGSALVIYQGPGGPEVREVSLIPAE